MIDRAHAPTLLLVDDDRIFRERLARAMEIRGFQVWQAEEPIEGLRIAERETPEVAIVDLRMPGGSGLDLVRKLRDCDPATVIVMLTGYASIPTAIESVRSGANDYLQKPVGVEQILASLRKASVELPDGSSNAIVDQEATRVPSLARVEWEHIQRVLSDCDGNLSAAAKVLGIHRRSLQRKLAKDPVRS
jgi:two-component system, response regulator RegA